MNKKQIIRLVAKRVRKACEVFVDSDECEGYDFHKQRDLDCMCAVASDTLQKELRKSGIYAKFIEGKWFDDKDDEWGSAHCWLEWKGYVIDITATQFDIIRKVILTKNTGNSFYYGKGKGKEMSSRSNLRGWPKEQKPSRKLYKKIMVCA